MPLNKRSPAVLALAETLGISKQRCITLLAASSGDIERAANIHYSHAQHEQAQSGSRGSKRRQQQAGGAGGKEEAAAENEQPDDDSKDREGIAAAMAEEQERVELTEERKQRDSDDMPRLESPHAQPLATLIVSPAQLSSAALPLSSSHPRPVLHITASTASSSDSASNSLAARVKSEAPSARDDSNTARVASVGGAKAKPLLFAPSSSAAVKREPAAASVSSFAHLAQSKAPRLFSAAGAAAPVAAADRTALKTERETTAAPFASPPPVASTSASAPTRPPGVSASSSSSSPSPAAPRVERLAVRIIDTINPDTSAIIMRFPLDTTLHRVYAELERRGFPRVRLFHAKSELSPELTPRELCLVDKCVLEMEYGQQTDSATASHAAVGEKRSNEEKEEPSGVKRQRLQSTRTGKQRTGRQAEAREEKMSDEQEAESSDVADVGFSPPPAPAPLLAPSVVEPASLHMEHPVTFSHLRLGSVTLHVRARAKTIAKRSHNFADLLTAIRGGAVPPSMAADSLHDERLLTLLSDINSGQRHPIGVEVKWQRVQAALATDSADDCSEAGSSASDEQPSLLSSALSMLQAIAGQLNETRRQVDRAKYKWLHTFDVELFLLPVCIGWSVTHMNELLELLWGDKWQQLMSRVWSGAYRPGDGKPAPPMDQTSLLRMAQRFDYHATLDDSVLHSDSHSASLSAGLTADSHLIASGRSLSPFPFRTPPPYESSETIGLRYLVQRERQKAVSSWLQSAELEPHQLSIESSVGLALRDYQQQSVLWMLGQELRESGSEAFWIECRLDGQPLLYSPLFQQWRMGPLEHMRGGLLCDTMGLGKTIVTLAVINLRPAPSDFHTSSLAASFIASPSRPVRSRATLIIAPVSLVPQWEAELRQHSLRPLRIYCFYGSARETNPRVIAEYDVVLTTYGVLASDTSGQRFRRRKGAPSIFHCIEWWRVVIDEGHLLRTTSSRQANAATAILSQQRHILTGTPVSSSVTELRGLFAFLQCKVLADSPTFWSHLQAASRAAPSTAPPTPEEERSFSRMTFSPHAVYAVAELIFRRLSMRHTKDQPFNHRATLAPLPPRTDAIHKVDFTPAQRAAYDELYGMARRKWDELVRRGQASSAVIQAFSYLLPLRQACAGTVMDMAEVRRREELVAQRMEEAKRADESRRAHLASMQLPALPNDAEDDDEAGEEGSNRQYAYATTLPFNQLEDECVVCLSEFCLPLQTKCGHLFCAECILAVIDTESEPTCPQCRARVTKATLRRPRPRPPTPPPQRPPPEPSEEPVAAAFSSSSSPAPETAPPALPVDAVLFDAKLEVVVSHILQLQRSDPSTKALVFSQFTSTLTYLATRLSALHVATHRISGDMPMTARRRVLHSFNSAASFSVFLLTPRVGAVGLTLTSASHCFLIEPALNWTLTEQAVGRVHRLGQQRPVTCVHYVMRGSVEEKIEAVTRDKRGAEANRDGEVAADGSGDARAAVAAGSAASAAADDDSGGSGIGSAAMIGLNSMGSMKKDAAVYRVQEMEKLFER